MKHIRSHEKVNNENKEKWELYYNFPLLYLGMTTG